MAIEKISLTDFRSLQNTQLALHPELNVITGDNGAGKTSLLEAINLVAQGRSQITSSLNEVIRHGKTEAILFTQVNGHRVGFRRINGETEIRLDGQSIKRLSQLVDKAPIQSLNNKSFELSIARPNEKRQFIDWCLFHVEQSYRDTWLAYRHTLKQRNRLLKERKQIELIDYWDDQLVLHSNRIRDLREMYSDQIVATLKKHYEELIGDMKVDVEYKQGWDPGKKLADIYKENRERELRYGYTLYGIQRDTLKINSGGISANAILSRGQVKRLSIAMYLAQITLVQELTNKGIIVLVDDLVSELDANSVKRVLGGLQRLKLQVVLTGIRAHDLPLPSNQLYSMFHVEHGIIRPVLNH